MDAPDLQTPSASPRPAPRVADLMPRGEFRDRFRALIFQPQTMAATVFMIVFCSIMTPGQYLFGLNVWARMLLNTAAAVFFLGATWALLPGFLWQLMRRNIPWIYAQLLVYVPVHVSFCVTVWATLYPAPELSDLLWLIFVVQINVILATVLTLLALQRMILREFAGGMRHFPLWTRVPPARCGLQQHLPEGLRARP